MPYTFPHAQLSSVTTQSIAVANTPQAVTFDTDEFKRKITHDTVTNNSRITMLESGQYDFMVVAQTTSSAANKTLDFWFRVNGTTDVPRSNLKTVITNAGDSAVIMLEFCFAITAGQYVELMVSGDSTSLSLPSFAAGTSPTRPVTPSVLLTVSKM